MNWSKIKCRLECETIKVNVFLIYWMCQLKMFRSSWGRAHVSRVRSDDRWADDTLRRNWVLWGVRDREWGAERVRAERSHGVCLMTGAGGGTGRSRSTHTAALSPFVWAANIYQHADKHMHTDGTTPKQQKLQVLKTLILEIKCNVKKKN